MIETRSGWAVECNYAYRIGIFFRGWFAGNFQIKEGYEKTGSVCIFSTREDARNHGKEAIKRKFCVKARAVKVKEFLEVTR